jgi:hypothetical protein
MHEAARDAIEASRQALLSSIGDASDVSFIRQWGNIGDDLIYAGTRQLLRDVPYREISVLALEGEHGDVALLCGSGAWCGAYHHLPECLAAIEQRFDRVIVLPSSFDTTIPEVRDTLARTKATVFARERTSYELIESLCDTRLAHDTAFFFDFGPYVRRGDGTLTAYRTDPEAISRVVPGGNNDIAETCASLDEFLWTIARHERVLTDRAHVTIAAAMLGKLVAYSVSNYHKVQSIVDYALGGFSVERVPMRIDDEAGPGPSRSASEPHAENRDWRQRVMTASNDLRRIAIEAEPMVLIDGDELRDRLVPDLNVIPFLGRDGQYWGPPADSAAAIQELETLRAAGARWLVLAWPSFWWRDHYAEFWDHASKRYTCCAETEDLVVIRLF